MTIFEVNGTQYELCDNLHEVSLARYITFDLDVQPTKPEAMKEFERTGDGKVFEQVADADYDLQFLPYFAGVGASFSNCPKDVFLQCSKDSLERMYFAISRMLSEPKDMGSAGLRIGKYLYYFPSRLMIRETVQDFIEAAQTEKQLTSQNKNIWQKLAAIAPILLRKRGEKYSDELLKRTPEMLKMSMFQAWQLLFFLKRQNDIFETLIRLFSSRAE